MLFKSPVTLGTGDFGRFFPMLSVNVLSASLTKAFSLHSKLQVFCPHCTRGKIPLLSHQQCCQRWFRLFTKYTIELSGRSIFPLQQAFLIPSLFSPLLSKVGFSLGLSLHLGFMLIYCQTFQLLLLLAQSQDIKTMLALLDPSFLYVLSIMKG